MIKISIGIYQLIEDVVNMVMIDLIILYGTDYDYNELEKVIEDKSIKILKRMGFSEIKGLEHIIKSKRIKKGK